MDWFSATIKDDGTITVPERWLHLHYYEALNILFRMENALRVFVYVILKAKFKDGWDQLTIQISDDEKNSTIAAASAKRLAQAQGYGYLGYEITSPLMYLNSGELTRLITSEANWNLFKPFFRGRRELIRTKLDEISTIRNALAHFRPIKYDDIELIKQNVKHTFIGIEQCLADITETRRVVPTNTPDNWYVTLSTLGTNLCKIQLFQSKSEEWIRLRLGYSCPVLRQSGSDAYMSIEASNLISPAIIRNFPGLAKHSIFVTEGVGIITKEKGPAVFKNISFLLSRKTIEENYGEIDGEMKQALLKIENETELLQKDNLARGDLVDSARVWADLKEKGQKYQYWSADLDNFKCKFREHDPPEYWGEVGLNRTDFVSSADWYPWMPSSIAKKEDDIPF